MCTVLCCAVLCCTWLAAQVRADGEQVDVPTGFAFEETEQGT